MDHMNENIDAQQKGYVPRPGWQIWAARIGLVFMIGFVIYQLLIIAGAGL
ncbi:MAG: hypothetical protein ACI3V0_05295 [Faecousia sp.]